MAKLRERTSAGFNLPNEQAKDFTLASDAFALALAMLSVLYQSGHEEGQSPSAVLEQVRRIVSASREPEAKTLATDLESKRDDLLNLLAERPEYNRNQRIESVQRVAFPALADAHFWIDLRVTGEGQGNEVKLVPVVLARFRFDEPLSSAADSIAFQLPDSALSLLRDQLTRLEKRMSEVQKRLASELL